MSDSSFEIIVMAEVFSKVWEILARFFSFYEFQVDIQAEDSSCSSSHLTLLLIFYFSSLTALLGL